MGVVAGWDSSFDCLDEHLAAVLKTGGGPGHRLKLTMPSDREIKLVREFDVPRRLVFEAFSKPEYIRQWWGPRAFTMTDCEMDFRPTDAWRFVHRAPDGQEHPFKGVYKEIVRPERLEYTFIYDVEGYRDYEAVETVTLEEHDGRTIATDVVAYPSKEARDGQLCSGMEAGAAESMDRLEELLKTMA